MEASKTERELCVEDANAKLRQSFADAGEASSPATDLAIDPLSPAEVMLRALRPGEEWLGQLGDRRIVAAHEYVAAASALVEVRRSLRAIAARHEPEIKAGHAAHKKATEAKRSAEGELPTTETALVELCAHWLRMHVVDEGDDTTLVPVNENVPPIEGFGWTVRYRPIVRNAKKLINAVARGRVPLEAIAINERWLKERVTALREAFTLPGVGYEIVVVPVVTEPEKPAADRTVAHHPV